MGFSKKKKYSYNSIQKAKSTLKLGTWATYGINERMGPVPGADYYMQGQMGVEPFQENPPKWEDPIDPTTTQPTYSSWGGKTLFSFGGAGCDATWAKIVSDKINENTIKGFIKNGWAGINIDNECGMEKELITNLVNLMHLHGLQSQITVSTNSGKAIDLLRQFENLDYLIYMPYGTYMNDSDWGLNITKDGTVTGNTIRILDGVLDGLKDKSKIILAATPWWKKGVLDWTDEQIIGWGKYLSDNGFGGSFWWFPTGYTGKPGKLAYYINILKQI